MSADAYRREVEQHFGGNGGAEITQLRLHEDRRFGSSELVGEPLPQVPQVAREGGRRVRGKSEPWWLRYGTSPYLVLTDVAAFLVATVVASPTSLTAHLAVLVVNLLVFSVAGLYRSRLNLSVLDHLPYIVAAVLVSFTVQTTLLAWLPGADTPRQLVVHAGVLLLTVALFRWMAYAVVRMARRQGWVKHRTVILGAGQVGTHLALTLLERHEYGLEPVGFVDSMPPLKDVTLFPLPVLGGYHELEQVIRRHDIRDVIVAFGTGDESELVDVLTTCDRIDVEVFMVPRLLELHNSRRDTDDIWGIPVIRRRQATFRSPWWKVKRVTDVLASSAALLALSPILAVCAIAVRLEGGPGILFRQQRVGLDGKPFQMLKFRSLRPVDDTESETNWNIKHDDRLGPVGKFLRQSSLDELPQLWNILRGDMSLVGPRPERQHFVDQFSTHIPRYTARHRVPAGLTGWSQAHGLRGDTSIHDRARFDNYYVENWSPWLDAKIIVKTIGQVVGRRGG